MKSEGFHRQTAVLYKAPASLKIEMESIGLTFPVKGHLTFKWTTNVDRIIILYNV